MSGKGRHWVSPFDSTEELIEAVRRESAAALSTADAFFQDTPRKKRFDVPRRFPASAPETDDRESSPGDGAEAPPAGPVA